MKDIVLIDKPAGWTSFDVVAKIRGTLKAEYVRVGIKPTKKQLRVGHAGTLDPFATGLLIILLGDACKDAGTFLKLDKTYEFTAMLGQTSTTGDPEGEITDTVRITSEPAKSDVEMVLGQFKGVIQQTPPAYSAIKVGGKRAYKLAREGKPVEISPRDTTIHALELISYRYPKLSCVCEVSSGTYIRSLVADIGSTLEVGAYCSQLRRTKIGSYDIKDAIKIEELTSSLVLADTQRSTPLQ